jgi:hypothetical protein
MMTEDDVTPTMIGDNKHTILVNSMDMNSTFLHKAVKRQAKLGNKDHFTSEPVSKNLKDTEFVCVAYSP